MTYQSLLYLPLYYIRTILLLMGTLLSIVSYAIPYIGPIPNADIKNGYVMARSVVLDPQAGEPILVEYNTNGDEANTVSVGGNYRISELAIIPASDYRFYKKQLEDFKAQYQDTLAKDAELMTRNEFLEQQYLAADNITNISPPNLPNSINSVFVRGQVNRIIPNSDELVLLQFPLDMTQTINISDDTISLVVSPEGQILAHSTKNIGYRTGFFGKPEDPAEANKPFSSVKEHEGDKVFGPVGLVPVTNGFGGNLSNKEGRYALTSIYPPCPPGGFSFTDTMWVELNYRNFLPTGSAIRSYYLSRPDNYSCYAALISPTSLSAISAGLSIQATLSTSSTFLFQRNFFVDVMFVTGNMQIRNLNKQVVNVTDSVTHTSFTEPAEEIEQNFYDFNGDNQADKVIRGDFETRTIKVDGEDEMIDVFTPNNKGTLQGIFFDGIQNDEEDPDILRLIDKDNRKTKPVGILKTISKADLRNTDVLFFRESTGELIMERRGLKNTELDPERTNQSPNPEVDLDKRNSEQVAYRVMLRGAADHRGNIGGAVRNRSKSYEEWATEYQLEEPFQQRESDHLRAGEFIKIVAINRPTGYMATARVQLKPADNRGTGAVDIVVPTMTLYPPNLKIWAERNYDIKKGLTKGENRNYTIGAEGAALTTDKTITIYTEWLDEFGKPFPDELGLSNGEEYGLTARLAKVVPSRTLRGVGVGADLAEFAIAPGRHTQVINVGSNLTTAEHFYIHVIGKAKKQECISQVSCPSFTTLGTQAPYDARPNLLVPFLVPLADEDRHWMEFNAYKDLKRKYYSTPIPPVVRPVKPNKPLPAYAWQYRPEYQFSQYDFKVQKINQTKDIFLGINITDNILNDSNPTISAADKMLEVYYSLINSTNPDLIPINNERELVLTIGEIEVAAPIGNGKKVSFTDLKGLSAATGEEFTTIRLYNNHDVSNVLWEWAFKTLVDRFIEADNHCNSVPNNKQDLEKILSDENINNLIVAYEPENNKIEVLINGLLIQDNLKLVARKAASPSTHLETQTDIVDGRYKISFTPSDQLPDEKITIAYYIDNNKNNTYDQSETLSDLEFAEGDELSIIAISKTAYEEHEKEVSDEVLKISGPSGAGYELFQDFLAGAPSSEEFIYVRYTKTPINKPTNTKKEYLDIAWTHGAGAAFRKNCFANLPNYKHSEGSILHDKVKKSLIFFRTMKNIAERHNSFKKSRDESSSSCISGDCMTFTTSDEDIDIDFVIPAFFGSDTADLGTAIGAAKFLYTANVRYKTTGDPSNPDHLYDIKVAGEIYDTYDFNYGKTNFFQDFNSDGAAIQLGYESNRKKGAVFVTSVLFEIHYHVDCKSGLNGDTCTFNRNLKFSNKGDFNVPPA